MRFQFPPLTPLVKRLLILQGVAFVALAIVEILGGVRLFPLLSLQLEFGEPVSYLGLAWQPVTYWLVYPPQTESLLGLLLSMVMVYFFLGPFESTFGPRKSVALCAVGILAAAAACVGFAHVLPSARPMFGASVLAAASFGAFPVLFGDRDIFLFPLMIPLKPWTALGIGAAVVALIALLAQEPFIFVSDIAAMGAGIGYARFAARAPAARKKPRRRGGPDLRVIRGGEDDDEPPRWLN